MSIEIQGVAPLVQVFDMPTSIRSIATCSVSK